ncbi:MAG: helix-turn-helix domain-containing protein, partial [Anaeroplasmataceae bacterium]|nr:helix-turn-helix domain-containing protein [Anaeroplasmataceae bacterium]
MFHDNIKRFRLAKGWTQEELAEKLNVTRQTISKWEQGINEPDIDTLKKLSEVFDVSIDELIGDKKEKKENRFPSIVKICNVVSISLCIFVCLVLVIITRYLYNRIPMHYNLQGEINRWGSKWEWLWLLPYFVVILGTDLLCCRLIINNSTSKSMKAGFWITKVCCWISQAVGLGIFLGATLAYLKKGNWYPIINGVTYTVVLSFLIFLHPSIIKQNQLFGFRTNFTCSNVIAWNKINKMAFYVLNINCIVCIVLQLLYNQFWYNLLISSLILVGLFIMFIY